MSAWLKRFGLHLAAAVGATGIFVAAAAVGATQTRQQVAIGPAPEVTVQARTPGAQRKPSVVVATPSPTPAPTAPIGTEATSQPSPHPTGTQETAATPLPTPGSAQAPSGPTPGPAGQGQTAPATRLPAGGPPGAVAAQPGTAEAQPGAVDVQPEPEQPQPAVQPQPLGPPGAPKPGGAAAASPRPTPRATPTARTSPSPTPAAQKVVPERSLAGTIKAVLPDGLDVMGVGGREWQVTPVPGALIRLNGKAARLEALQAGDTVVILGQAQGGGAGNRFLAHAITARRA